MLQPPAAVATYELLFDTLAHSDAPRAATLVALGVATAIGARSWWLARRGRAWFDVFAAFFSLVLGMFVLAAGAYTYELRQLASGAVVPRVVEGPITRLWHDRTVRGGRTVARWEGFRVADVPFVYEEATRDNYWHNRPDQGGPLGEGVRVRLHYLERVGGGRARRDIVRVELATR
jgi:hypothetical protein